MKKLFTILITSIFLLLNSANFGQIILEHTFPGPNSTAADRGVRLINIGNNHYKYVYTDYTANQLKLFNLDFTPYYTVNVPITLVNVNTYSIGYITYSLFDCDTSMFEYAIMAGGPTLNFYIYRQDGTLLFERDSTIAPYAFGSFSGSYDLRPIVNSPDGTKLFLCHANSSLYLITTDVYSLCGTLPVEVEVDDQTPSVNFVQEYPNPSSGIIEFKFQLPSNFENYELVIYDSSGQIQNKITIPGTTINYKMEEQQLSSGTYYFSLNTKNKVLQSDKFIITK